MAYDFDKMNDRARHRDLAQRRREQIQKRQQFLRWTMFAMVLTVSLLILIIALVRKDPANTAASGTTQTTTAPTQTTTTPPATTLPAEPETVIRLVFGGDVNITDKVVAAGGGEGSFDYTQLLMDIAPVFSDANAAFLNLEGGFYGAPYGSASFSAPQALASALADIGVDMIQLANSRSIANGLAGLSATIDQVRAAGMYPLGAFANTEEQQAQQGFTLVNIGGIRVAIVAFTKGMDGMSLPAGSEGCVNLLYTDYATTYQTVDEVGITTVLQAAQAQEPDLTIAMVHWGSEYNDSISPTQKTIVELMQGLGVDAIVGTHSHFVQKVDYNAEAGTVVAYSLGDLLGDGEKAGTNYSILLQLEITRDNTTGQTRITGCDYTGVYMVTPEKDGMDLRLLRIGPALTMYENNHIGRITDLAYENMLYAWKRIQSRVTG